MTSKIKFPVIWDIKLPILKNPLLWFQLFIIGFVVFVFMFLLLVGINLFEYQWQEIPTSIVVAATIGGGFFVVLSLTALLLFGRGVPTSYVLAEDHIEQHTLRKQSKIAQFLPYLGILTGNSAALTAKGAGLLAKSREVIGVVWKDVNKVEFFPQRNEIHLKNDWRTVIQVICPSEQYNTIKQIISKKVTTNKQQLTKQQTTPSNFPQKWMLSLFIVVAGALLFIRLPIHYVGIFTIATIISAFLALWTTGLKKHFFALALLLLPVIAVTAAYFYREVSFTRPGAIYAFIIEVISIGFFMLLSLSILFKKIK